jgi:hypothetical protein
MAVETIVLAGFLRTPLRLPINTDLFRQRRNTQNRSTKQDVVLVNNNINPYLDEIPRSQEDFLHNSNST